MCYLGFADLKGYEILKKKIINSVLSIGMLTMLSGCINMEEVRAAIKHVDLPELPQEPEKEIEEYTQRKIATAMAASEMADPETYNLKDEPLYECLVDYGQGIPGRYFNKAYVLSGKNGSILLNQSNPNLHFSTSESVEENEGILRLVTPNYRFDWNGWEGEDIDRIGGVRYKCEKSLRRDLFKDNVNAVNDITYAMSYDTVPIATTINVDSVASRDYLDSKNSRSMDLIVSNTLANWHLDTALEYGSTDLAATAGLSAALTLFGPMLVEKVEKDKAEQFSCKLVRGKGFSYGAWPHKWEIDEDLIQVKATKSFVYLTDSRGTEKIMRGLFPIRAQNINDLLIIVAVDTKTKQVTQEAMLDCGTL